MVGFVGQPPSAKEIERLRLVLSTFRDGSGQQRVGSETYPGWRDFERAMAAVFSGEGGEDKAVFDVTIPLRPGVSAGISCKTSAALNGHVLMELHNSLAKALDWLNENGLTSKDDPALVGPTVVAQVAMWHELAAAEYMIDLAFSSYVILTHTRDWQTWQLHQFSLDVLSPDPGELSWSRRMKHIRGEDHSGHMLWQWYADSGGQLKYFPKLSSAIWSSNPFELEKPNTHALHEWAEEMFPDLWPNG